MKSVGIRLEPNTVLTNLQSLECRKEFWTNRVQNCHSAGIPEMAVACTRRQNNLEDTTNVSEFLKANEKFRDEVLFYLISFFHGFCSIKTGLELFVGPGVFYRKLVNWIHTLYGIDFVQDNLDYIRSLLPTSASKLLCVPAHCIEQERSPEGFHPEDLDVILAFRGFIHQPVGERQQTLKDIQKILKSGGYLVIGELFEDDRPKERPVNKGTWYWEIDRYKKELKKMDLVSLSNQMDNDGDPCRVAIFQKK